MGNLFPSIVLAATLWLVGCGGQAVPPKMSPAPSALPSNQRLLFQPTSDAEGLLGRPVTIDEQGEMHIGQERAPGCELLASEAVPQRFEEHYVSDVGSFLAAGAGIEHLAKLRADRSERLVSTLDIQNEFMLRGRLHGPCGDTVVRAVLVGSGRRSMFARQSAQGMAEAGVPDVGLGASMGAKGHQYVDQGRHWKDALAWAVELGQVNQELQVEVRLEPMRIEHGGSYRIFARANQPVTLVVVVQEDREVGDAAAVLIPGLGGRQVQLRPGVDTPLPEARAILRDPTRAQHDMLYVYALRHEADLGPLHLTAGLTEKQATEEALRVMEILNGLPGHRVALKRHGYDIVPSGEL